MGPKLGDGWGAGEWDGCACGEAWGRAMDGREAVWAAAAGEGAAEGGGDEA